MRQTHVIEGTWEEIKLHEAEFAGHQLRVIVNMESIIGHHATSQDRLVAWNSFVSSAAVSGAAIDDSRDAIYGFGSDRG